MLKTIMPKFILESISKVKEGQKYCLSQTISGVAFVEGLTLAQLKCISEVIGNEIYCHKMRKQEDQNSATAMKFTFHSSILNTSESKKGHKRKYNRRS